MLETFRNRIGLIELYIEKGEIEKSLEQAEEVLRNHPESYAGYLLMTCHYYALRQSEDAQHWMDETLQRAPEDEAVLEVAIMMYQDFKTDELKLKELIEVGLRLYPDNHFFHIQFAYINQTINLEQTLASYQEAIRLSPQNEKYLAGYALLMYQKGNKKEADKFEKLSLAANPEDTGNLVNFAFMAYQFGKYKKAQLLIDQAMRMEPNDELVRKYYKMIYPTKNPFIRIMTGMNYLLGRALVLPADALFKLFKKKIPYSAMVFLVMILEFGGLIALLGKGSIFIIGAYIVLLFTSSKLKKTFLKKIGFTDADEELMKQKADENQKSALKEMEKALMRDSGQSKPGHSALPSSELEAQLSQIWDSTNISSIREESEEDFPLENVKLFQSGPPIQQDLTNIATDGDGAELHALPNNEQDLQTSPTLQQDPIKMEWPKEQSRWPVVIISVAIIFGMIVRFGPSMIEDANRPAPLSPEIKETIHTTQENLAQEKESAIIDENKQVVELFIQSVREDNMEHTMSDIISEEYVSVILENMNEQFILQLENAEIEKMIQPHAGLSISYFLIVNEEENMNVIMEVSFGRITHIYAENFNQSEEEEVKYKKLMEQMDLDGEHVQ